MLDKDFGVFEHKVGDKVIPVVSSRSIARVFDKEHKNVLRDIENAIEDIEKYESSGSILSPKREIGNNIFSVSIINTTSWKNNFIPSTYKGGRGERREYLSTEKGTTFLTMGYTGPQVNAWKRGYIDEFNEMKELIHQREKLRLEFPELTDAIKEFYKDSKNPDAGYHFSNEINMINRIVLDMDAAKFKKLNNIPSKGISIRSYFTKEQSFFWDYLQRLNILLLDDKLNYEERKFKLNQKYTQKLIQYKEKELQLN